MPIVAAVPSLALIAGSSLALFFPSFSRPVADGAVAIGSLLAIVAWTRCRAVLQGHHTRWRAAFLMSLACAFGAGGALLAQHEWAAAWRPPLRIVFDEAVNADKADAAAQKRFITEDVAIPMEIVGLLRADASPTDTGASISVDVQAVSGEASPSPHATAGGVLLTVVGDEARAAVGTWRAGRTVRVTAQLRRPSRYFDPGVPDEEHLLARRGTTLVGTVKSAALIDLVSRGSWLSESAAAVRAFTRRAIADAVGSRDAQAGAIVTAIVIGDRTALDDSVQRHLQEAGTYHVIAISGGNIAILAGLTLLAFRVAGVLGRAAMLSAIVGLVAYGYLVGGGASVDRATLMAVIFFASRAIDQRSPPFNTLAVVAGLLVASDPLTVADPAFILTFGATAAILAVMPLVAQFERVPAWLVPAISMLVASAASETALLPVSAFVFSRVTFAGLGLNFLAIPLMAVAQVAGMALVPIALVSAKAASLAGWIAYISAQGLVWSASLVRFVPALTWRVAAPGWTVMGMYYAGLLIVWTTWRSPPSMVGQAFRRGVTAVGVLCTVCAALWLLFEPWSYFANRGDGDLHVTFIDVGQGDSAFIRFPRGASLLVDTGGVPGNFDIGDRVVAPVLRALGVHRLQTIALTHGDNDHIGGAPSVMREFTPADVWEGVPMPAFAALKARRDVAT
ncbi:MAG TPA: ComEC/Rec2 family competence protein, partial [Vicinamibacterales bacterium]|nr:ComEC/Rec2 family competence protein [Vicinamibacterales bacterium]